MRTKSLVYPSMHILICPFMNSAPAPCWTMGTPRCLRSSLPVLMGKHSVRSPEERHLTKVWGARGLPGGGGI